MCLKQSSFVGFCTVVTIAAFGCFPARMFAATASNQSVSVAESSAYKEYHE